MKKNGRVEIAVYKLLEELDGRADTMGLIEYARQKRRGHLLHTRIRECLEKLKEKGYVSRDKNELPYKWFITKKL